MRNSAVVQRWMQENRPPVAVHADPERDHRAHRQRARRADQRHRDHSSINWGAVRVISLENQQQMMEEIRSQYSRAASTRRRSRTGASRSARATSSPARSTPPTSASATSAACSTTCSSRCSASRPARSCSRTRPTRPRPSSATDCGYGACVSALRGAARRACLARCRRGCSCWLLIARLRGPRRTARKGARSALDAGQPREALAALNEQLEVDSDEGVPEKIEGDKRCSARPRDRAAAARAATSSRAATSRSRDKQIEVLDFSRSTPRRHREVHVLGRRRARTRRRRTRS